MKIKSIYVIALAASVSAALAGCSDSWAPEVEGAGEGRLNTASILAEVNTVEDDVDDNEATHARGARSTIDLSSFLVDVVRSSDNVTMASWTYSEMPQLPTFAVGSYEVKVRSCELKDAEWSAPYYVGSQTFEIRNGEVTDVAPIVCKLENIRVSVSYGPRLLEATNGGEGFTVTVTSVPGVFLQFTGKETRSGYFAYTGQTTMVARFEGQVNGVHENFVHVLENVAPGQHRKIMFKLNYNPNVPDDEVGTIDGQGIYVSCSTQTVDVDGNITQEEDNISQGDRPNQEEKPDEPIDPGVESKIKFTSETLAHNENGEVLDNTPNNAADFGKDKQEAKVGIHSDDPIAHVKVNIESGFLTEDELDGIGLIKEFDLADPMPTVNGEVKDLRKAFESLGFPMGDDVVGKNDLVFDITTFVPLLGAGGPGDHLFTLTVEDQNGGSKSLKLLFRTF